MKKIILELVITAGVVIMLMVCGAAVKNNVYAADVYRVTASRVEDTVVCYGKIQYKEACEVTPPSVGRINDIAVVKGDIVDKNDILFTMSADIPEEYSQLEGMLSDIVKKSELSITAPVSGKILDIGVKQGDEVVNTQTAVTIVNSKDLCVSIPVSESKIPVISDGQKVKITGSALGDKEYDGVVSEIDNVAKQVITTSGKETAVNVTVDINNPDDSIRQGYTAKCTIITKVKNNDYIIPYEAVEMESGSKGAVYTYNKGKAVRKTVRTGNEYENGIEILSGIKENDLIINFPDKMENKESAVKINKLLENNNA